jgi:hypothetical protein
MNPHIISIAASAAVSSIVTAAMLFAFWLWLTNHKDSDSIEDIELDEDQARELHQRLTKWLEETDGPTPAPADDHPVGHYL